MIDKCVCASINPGDRVAAPKSSVREPAGMGASLPTARMVEPLTTTTPGVIILRPSNIRAAFSTTGCASAGNAAATTRTVRSKPPNFIFVTLLCGRLLLRIFAPDVLSEPVVVVLHYSPLLFRLVNGMAESLVKDQFYRDSTVLQGLIKLERIGWRHAFVLIAVLDQRGSFGVVDVVNRRSLLVNAWILPRSRLQILACKGVNVGVHIVRRPVGDARADRYRAKTVAISRDKRRNVTALAPAHRAYAILIYHALCDQVVYARDHIRVIAQSQIADIERPKLFSVSRRAPVIRL